METQADQDLDWLYNIATAKNVSVAEIQEDVFLEHVGKHHNDRDITGNSLLACRKMAFEQTFGVKF